MRERPDTIAETGETITPAMVDELLSLERSLRSAHGGDGIDEAAAPHHWTRQCLKNLSYLREVAKGQPARE